MCHCTKKNSLLGMDSISFWIFIFISVFILGISADCEKKPKWDKVITENKRYKIRDWLLENAKKCEDSDVDYPSFDGWYHNLAKIEQGSIGQSLVRGWAGIKTNASQTEKWTKVWSEVMSVTSMCKTTNNALALFLGKQIASEVLNTGKSSCAEMCDSELNYATPYIDGGIIYGTSRHWTNKYISSKDGTILFDNSFLPKIEDIYPLLLKIIWIRWHNMIAKELHTTCTNWSAEKIFNEARKFTIALQQRIYVYEWLPAWTGKNLGHYERYDPLLDPQIEKTFQAATLLSQSVSEYHCSGKNCKKLKNATTWENNSLKDMMENLVFGLCKSNEKYAVAKNARQSYELPDVNHARNVYKLKPYHDWKDFSQSNNVKDSMQLSSFVQNDLKQLDTLLGGCLESKNGPGPLFVEVILDQFRRIRDGDRLWFENKHNNLFSNKDDICKINQTTLADIFLTVTDVTNGDLGNQSSSFLLFKANKSDAVDYLISLKDAHFSKNKTKASLENFARLSYTFLLIVLSIFSVIAISIICLITCKKYLTKSMKMQENENIKKIFQEKWQIGYPCFLVREFDGKNTCKTRAILVLEKHKKQIIIHSTAGTILRAIEFENSSKTRIQILTITSEPVVILKSSNNYDLVLNFQSKIFVDRFISELTVFLTETIKKEKPLVTNMKWGRCKRQLLTKLRHQSLLEMFFRVAFAQAFKIEHSLAEMLDVDTSVAVEVVYTELTKFQFAECLSMDPEHDFVKNIFALVDRDQKGSICFRAFLDLIILFANGKPEEKAHLLFKLYDINGTALLPAKEFTAMLNSFIEIVGDGSTENSVQPFLKKSGVEHKDQFDFRDFKRVFGHEFKKLSCADLESPIQSGRSYLSMVRQTLESMYRSTNPGPSPNDKRLVIDKEQEDVLRSPERSTCLKITLLFCESYSKQVFWYIFIALVTLYLFVDKVFYFYSTTKLIGLGKYMLAISKGAPYGIVITYSLLFLTMCQNISIKLEDTFLNRYWPFNDCLQIHYYVGYMSIIFTLIHIIGKVYLFFWFISFSDETEYRIDVLEEEVKYILELKWRNPTAVSGLLLMLIVVFIYIFAQPCLRRQLYSIFDFTHHLYPIVVVLLVIHGSLSQWSLTYHLLSGPLIMFLVDCIIGMKRRKIQLPVLRTEFLPSDVICLIVKRPNIFQYDVGQWVRLSIPQINPQTFFRFYLSSMPFEPNLRIYVLPEHPCSHQLRSLADVPRGENMTAQFRICMDGPYGNNNLQTWRAHDVTILVAGSSGVSVFASIIRDILHVLRTKTEIPCRKVYFVWTSKTQQCFEWMVDLIREVEDNDQKQFFSAHLFITEFYEKFELRTIMLNICEKHYQRISGRCLFTGLKAVTHFGRPNFYKLFVTVQSLHDAIKTVGVFSSGPISLIRDVEESCTLINLQHEHRFEHRFFNKC